MGVCYCIPIRGSEGERALDVCVLVNFYWVLIFFGEERCSDIKAFLN